MIIYLDNSKKGGLLHLDPPVRMAENFEFSFKSLTVQAFHTNVSSLSHGYPLQRWIPGFDYDENGEVILKF